MMVLDEGADVGDVAHHRAEAAVARDHWRCGHDALVCAAVGAATVNKVMELDGGRDAEAAAPALAAQHASAAAVDGGRLAGFLRRPQDVKAHLHAHRQRMLDEAVDAPRGNVARDSARAQDIPADRLPLKPDRPGKKLSWLAPALAQREIRRPHGCHTWSPVAADSNRHCPRRRRWGTETVGESLSRRSGAGWQWSRAAFYMGSKFFCPSNSD